MTRVASWIGLIGGAVAVAVGLGGVIQQPGGGHAFTAISGFFLAGGAILSLRGLRWGQILMCVLGLVLLVRYIPSYFMTYHVWPDLVLVALGTFTLGLGTLGFILDRFEPPKSRL
jgi:hypothetical protein